MAGRAWTAVLAAMAAAVVAWAWAHSAWSPLRMAPNVVLQLANPYVHRVNPPFPDKAFYFPDAPVLEAGADAIAAEWQALMGRIGTVAALPEHVAVDPLHAGVARRGAVRVLPLLVLGHRTANAGLFPHTLELLQRCAWVRGASILVLEPGTELAPRSGLSSALVRYHLAVDVPEPDQGGLNVEGRERQWRAGNGVVWDDRFLHTLRNTGAQAKVVLAVDIERRDVTVLAVAVDAIALRLLRWHEYTQAVLRTGVLLRKSL